MRERWSAIARANATKNATENPEAKASAAIPAAFPSGCPIQTSAIGNVNIVNARQAIILAPRITTTFWRDTNLVAMSRTLQLHCSIHLPHRPPGISQKMKHHRDKHHRDDRHNHKLPVSHGAFQKSGATVLIVLHCHGGLPLIGFRAGYSRSWRRDRYFRAGRYGAAWHHSL